MKKENTDSKFVKGLFGVSAWLLTTLPLLYAVYAHEWLMLGLILGAECGVAIGIAIKNHSSTPNTH